MVLADGSRLPYTELLLTVGSSPRGLGLPGGDLDGVHYLRTLDDSDRLRTLLASATRVGDRRLGVGHDPDPDDDAVGLDDAVTPASSSPSCSPTVRSWPG